MFPTVLILIIVTFLPGLPAYADSDELRYQKRGNYMEGIRGRLVSGELIELVSVKAFTADKQPADGTEYKLAFVNQEGVAPHITIRELQFQHGYWLDKVGELEKKTSVWEPGKAYVFSWSTRPVIRQKNIGLHELGAVVRLDNQAGAIEKVLPAVLYASDDLSPLIQSYAFTFKTLHDAQLNCAIAPRGLAKLPGEINQLHCGLARGKQAQTIIWKPVNLEPGWYTLTIRGFQLSDNEPLEQVIHFVHNGAIPKEILAIR